jgi:cyclopropane-fatty-acyl-phospholipid synthase
MNSVLEIARPSKHLLPVKALDRFCKKLLLSKLATIQEGQIEIIEGKERHVFGDSHAKTEHRAKVTIHRARAYSRIALGGSVGSGESYIDQDWECQQLTELVRIFVLNREVLETLDSGAGKFFAPLQSFLHRLRSNDESQARKNISAHYDLGNNFFSLFLDNTWMYSCGVFKSQDTTLEDAQHEKNDRICRKLRLKSTDHVVEIGTGWGGFAIHAAKNYGCKVTTTTISKAQFDLANERVKAEKLEDKITLLFEDYRVLTGTYDHLVSIEMIEAVGLNFMDTYFEKCSSLLKPGGAMLLQSILIQDQFFDHASKSVDFIQTHVFPGSAIPSVTRITDSVKHQTDMKLFHFEDIGPHYATTLNHWRKNLTERREEISRMGYPEHLFRLWNYYFNYCEGGFLERSISAAHFMFTKPKFREEPVLLDHSNESVSTSSLKQRVS